MNHGEEVLSRALLICESGDKNPVKAIIELLFAIDGISSDDLMIFIMDLLKIATDNEKIVCSTKAFNPSDGYTDTVVSSTVTFIQNNTKVLDASFLNASCDKYMKVLEALTNAWQECGKLRGSKALYTSIGIKCIYVLYPCPGGSHLHGALVGT